MNNQEKKCFSKLASMYVLQYPGPAFVHSGKVSKLQFVKIGPEFKSSVAV